MISWCGSWRTNGAAALTTEDGLGVGTPSGFGIQRQLQDADSGHRIFPLCTPGPAFTTRVRRNLLHFNPIPKFHTKTAPSYTTGTNWIFVKIFRREAKAWAAWKQNCPMNCPEVPHGCSAARDSCGTSQNTDFTFWGFCSSQLSPAFKFTYIKRKLNCSLQQRANHNKANILQKTYSLESIKNCQDNVPEPILGCQQHQCHSGLLSATSCGKNCITDQKYFIFQWDFIFHMATIHHIPSQLELCKGKEKPPLQTPPEMF